MKIKDLQHPYKEMALINQERQGNERDENADLDVWCGRMVPTSFAWDDTKEGYDFWSDVYYGKHPEITPEIKANYPEVFGEDNQPKYGQTVWVRDNIYESWVKK